MVFGLWSLVLILKISVGVLYTYVAAFWAWQHSIGGLLGYVEDLGASHPTEDSPVPVTERSGELYSTQQPREKGGECEEGVARKDG